jgi:hypothetical protein
MTEEAQREPPSTGPRETLTDSDIQHVQEHLRDISYDGASLYYDAATMANLNALSVVSFFSDFLKWRSIWRFAQ